MIIFAIGMWVFGLGMSHLVYALNNITTLENKGGANIMIPCQGDGSKRLVTAEILRIYCLGK